MADDKYISLERRFCEVTEEPSSDWSQGILGVETGDTWETIVPAASSPPEERSAVVVVVAPSGTLDFGPIARQVYDDFFVSLSGVGSK